MLRHKSVNHLPIPYSCEYDGILYLGITITALNRFDALSLFIIKRAAIISGIITPVEFCDRCFQRRLPNRLA
jgi:hypothetical protein